MPLRMTQNTLAVLNVLMGAAGKPAYGAEIGAKARLGSGSLYPVLDRLVDEGWVESGWEAADPRELGRPRRRYYELTGDGRLAAASALETARARTTPTMWVPTPIPGW